MGVESWVLLILLCAIVATLCYGLYHVSKMCATVLKHAERSLEVRENRAQVQHDRYVSSLESEKAELMQRVLLTHPVAQTQRADMVSLAEFKKKLEEEAQSPPKGKVRVELPGVNTSQFEDADEPVE